VNSGSAAPLLPSALTLGDGRWSRGLEVLRIARDGRVDLRAAILGSVAITWLPLLALSIVAGVAWDGQVGVPFLSDFLPYGQFLVAVPALLIAERIVPERLHAAAVELARSDLVAPEDGAELGRLFSRTVNAWGGPIVTSVILAVTLAATLASFVEARDWLTGSWQVSGDRLTLPGWWYLVVSLPVLRFLELRWIWRLLVWVRFLWRVPSLELEPRPSHPDRAGGLAFLGEAQLAFGWLVLAFGAQISCLIADQAYFQAADLAGSRGYVAAFIAISVLVLLLPLLAFTPKLARARYDSILYLSGRGFEAAGSVHELLRTSDGSLPADEVSGLADYGSLLDNARLMRPAPLELRHIFALVLVALLPFLPLVFLEMPAQEVLRTLVQLLL
jgi:hypothetical protein